MDTFLQFYGLPTVIISAVITLTVYLVKRFFGRKLPLQITNYIPFGLGIIIFLIYDMIATNTFGVSQTAICSGLICGSLSSLLCCVFENPSLLKSLSQKAMAIYYIIEPFVDKTALISLSSKIEKICLEQTDEKNKIKAICEAIVTEAKEEFIEKDFTATAKLCITAVNSIK